MNGEGDTVVANGDEVAPWFPERRLSPRYPAPEYQVWVEWVENDQLVRRLGQVQNIGRGGVCVLLDTTPPASSRIWIALTEDPSRPHPVEAALITCHECGENAYRVGLAWCKDLA
jgi:hypothetical protein